MLLTLQNKPVSSAHQGVRIDAPDTACGRRALLYNQQRGKVTKQVLQRLYTDVRPLADLPLS